MSHVHDANSPFPLRKGPSGLFVTGSDTNVGKTYVSEILLREARKQGLRVGAYKPAASGIAVGGPTDVEVLWKATGCRMSAAEVCPQQFAAPQAPCIAAELEDRQVDESLLVEGLRKWLDHSDWILVEGAGGFLSPISWSLTNADLASRFGFALVIVVANELGAVNQALLTLTCAAKRGLIVDRLIFSDVEPADPKVFERHCRMLRSIAPHALSTELPLVQHVAHGARTLT